MLEEAGVKSGDTDSVRRLPLTAGSPVRKERPRHLREFGGSRFPRSSTHTLTTPTLRTLRGRAGLRPVSIYWSKSTCPPMAR